MLQLFCVGLNCNVAQNSQGPDGPNCHKSKLCELWYPLREQHISYINISHQSESPQRPSKIAIADYISSRQGGVLGKVFN